MKRFKRQMIEEGGYGDFPPIKIAEIKGKRVIIDGHHRARAAGAAGIRDVLVEIIELPPDVARRYFEQAAEAAERLGLPF
ncbi:ParB N-terminal domain-containing protein [Bremerella sp. JC770]|uniref:ParB N-terminal domain-containing protein n=1 Tax=Bremerella sp. JC770 TaxID=3232137 RepID=UPI00345967C7